MISKGGWDFLCAMPQVVEAAEVAAELRQLQDKGDGYVTWMKRIGGAAFITLAAFAYAGATDHVPLAKVGFVTLVALHVVAGWVGTSFQRNWRRLAYLDGFSAARCGRPPDPYP